MKLMTTLLLTMLLSVFAIAETKNKTDITVVKVDLKKPIPGTDVGGGYFTLKNTSNKDLILIGAEVDGFKKTEMHDIITENGNSKMKMITEVKVPANGTLEFKSGGKHLMMFQPSADIQTKDKTQLTFKFKDNQSLKTEATLE